MYPIYLDYAATTPVDPEVIKAMIPYFTTDFGNASSIHSYGRRARQAVDEARKIVAEFLGCESSEVIFTSGGTESDNLAIRGLIASYENTNNTTKVLKYESKKQNTKPHIITTQIEHHAVLNTVKNLEKSGMIEATYLKPNSDGIVSVRDIESAIKPNTVLVSVMYVNNEIGTVQPIREIGKLIEKENKSRVQESKSPKEKSSGLPDFRTRDSHIYFHTDAVQAAEYFDMNVQTLHVDLLTFTAHKIYGPKGIGVLYIKKGTPIKPEQTGGEHEYRKRAGTENVPGIVGIAKAVEIVRKSKSPKVQILQPVRTSLRMTF